MKVELLKLDSLDRINHHILSVGADPISVDIMNKKAINLCLKVYDCPFHIGNILKQEALSIGIDVAVSSGCVTAEVEKTHCLIFGDARKLLTLSDKLSLQPFQALQHLGVTIKEYTNNYLSSELIFSCGKKTFNLKNQFLIMGILNITPDSFYDGGRFNTVDRALKRAEEMLEEGADIIDVGGESTRPGSNPVSLNEELNRVMPVVESLKKRLNCVLSVDTYKSKVAEECINTGVEIINDISGLKFDENMIKTLSRNNVGIIAMHIKGKPKNMQKNPQYDYLIAEINEEFSKILKTIEKAGIHRNRVVLDPGIGFGKQYKDNLIILNNIQSFKVFARPILVGVSRKSFIGHLLNANPNARLLGSIGANITAFLRGASVFRVHDVRETREALTVACSIASTK